MNLVVDCSFIMSSILPDEVTNYSIKYESYKIFAPAIFYLECNNVLLNAISRKRITENDYKEYIDIIKELPISIDKFSSLAESLYFISKLALSYSITSYDAAYLELAIRLNAKIVTFDKQLIIAAKKNNVLTLT